MCCSNSAPSGDRQTCIYCLKLVHTGRASELLSKQVVLGWQHERLREEVVFVAAALAIQRLACALEVFD